MIKGFELKFEIKVGVNALNRIGALDQAKEVEQDLRFELQRFMTNWPTSIYQSKKPRRLTYDPKTSEADYPRTFIPTNF